MTKKAVRDFCVVCRGSANRGLLAAEVSGAMKLRSGSAVNLRIHEPKMCGVPPLLYSGPIFKALHRNCTSTAERATRPARVT